jgi:uncharacterized protein (TIGR02246 family)
MSDVLQRIVISARPMNRNERKRMKKKIKPMPKFRHELGLVYEGVELISRRRQVLPMNSQTLTEAAADEDAIRAIHRRMIDAWNAGDALAFAAPFTDEADFVAFEGTHLKGRREIGSFHQEIFDTVVRGTRLQGEVEFVRFLSAALAVMHSVVRVSRERASRHRREIPCN